MDFFQELQKGNILNLQKVNKKGLFIQKVNDIPIRKKYLCQFVYGKQNLNNVNIIQINNKIR